MDYYDDETGEHRRLREPRQRKDQFNDFFTWATRVTIVSLCVLVYQQIKETEATLQVLQISVATTQIAIAKMSVTQDIQTRQLDRHSQNFDQIWQQLRQQPK